MKHDWEPTDNQGYSMECTRCGEHIYIGSSFWNKHIDADCPGSVENRMKKMVDELNRAKTAYHDGSPIMSDAEYDGMLYELKILEKVTGLTIPNSPTHKAHNK